MRFYTPGHIIKRPTFGQDTAGGPISTPVNHLTVRGKLWRLGGSKEMTVEKVGYFADSRFVTGIADIKETDIYISPDGQEYKIKAVAKRTRPDGTGHLEIDLEMVK